MDARILHAPGAGSASYTRGWLGALTQAGFAGQLLLIGPAPTAGQLDGLEAVDVVAEGARLCDEWWEQTALPDLLDGLRPDLFISPATTLPMLRCCPQVNVVYDLGFERHPQLACPPETGPGVVLECEASGPMEEAGRWETGGTRRSRSSTS